METLFENRTQLSRELLCRAYRAYYYEIRIGMAMVFILLGGIIVFYNLVGLWMTWPSLGPVFYPLLVHLPPIALGVFIILLPWLRAQVMARKLLKSFIANGLPLEVIRDFSDEGMTVTTAQSKVFWEYSQLGTCYFIKGLAIFYSGTNISAMAMERFTKGDPESFETYLRTKMKVK